MLSFLLAAAAFAPQGPGTSLAPVVVNEFVYDDTSTDDYEFIELYNRSPNPVDISLWKVVCNDTTSPPLGSGAVPTHTIPAGTILAPGAFYLIGDPLIVPTPVLGVSQQVAINCLENGSPDTCELQDFAGTVIDEITYEIGGFAPFTLTTYTYPGERGIQGDLAVGDGPTASCARIFDGMDNDDNIADFLLTAKPTPGGPNVQPSVLPYIETFDAGNPATDVPGWTGGFVRPKFVDPTVIDSNNHFQRPASPAGGLAMMTWDSTGGGNTVVLDTAPVDDVVVETYVWLEPTMAPFNPAVYTPALPPVLLDNYNYADGEWFCVGARGSISPNARPADLGTYWADIAPGVGTAYHSLSGVCWAHVRTPYYSRLYLVDCHDGTSLANPQNHTILAGPIDILPGINDGWQRLRLHLQGNDVVGNFGGNYGYDDGQRFSAKTTTTQLGQIYIGYREAILYNNNGNAGCHAPMFDLFDAHAPTTTKSFIGGASPTTVGTPAIDTDGLLIAGTTGFAITGSNLVPTGAPGYAFCGVALSFTSFPAGIPIPGAPATALAYVVPVLNTVIGFADANGNVRFPISLPPTTAYNGVPFVSQIVDFDFAMPNPTKVGLTRGMQTGIGQ